MDGNDTLELRIIEKQYVSYRHNTSYHILFPTTMYTVFQILPLLQTEKTFEILKPYRHYQHQYTFYSQEYI